LKDLQRLFILALNTVISKHRSTIFFSNNISNLLPNYNDDTMTHYTKGTANGIC
jgi:hypothetical protein